MGWLSVPSGLRKMVMIEHHTEPWIGWSIAGLVNRAVFRHPRAERIRQKHSRAILRSRLNRLPFHHVLLVFILDTRFAITIGKLKSRFIDPSIHRWQKTKFDTCIRDRIAHGDDGSHIAKIAIKKHMIANVHSDACKIG